MENSLTAFAVSLFIVASYNVYTGVSGKAFSDGSKEPSKTDTIQLAESTKL